LKPYVTEVTMELEGLRATVDSFLDYLGVALGTREDRLWAARRRVTAAIESGVRRGTGVSLAMAELAVGADLTEVDGFPVEEPLHFMRTWWLALARLRRRRLPSSPPSRFWRSSPAMLPLRALFLSFYYFYY
jgi:hypothetical protein